MPENVAGQSSVIIPVTCNDARNAQLWHAGADGRIRDTMGRCLDLKENSLRNGTPIIVYPCHGGLNQQFYPR